MNKLKLITDLTVIAGLTSTFTSDEKRDEVNSFFDWVYSSAALYLETGDVQFLNDAVSGGRVMSHANLCKDAMSVVSAHTLGKTQFTGKASKPQLKAKRELTDKLLAQVEAMITKYREEKAAKATEVKTTEQLVTEFEAMLARKTATLIKAGVSNEAIATIYTKAASDIAIDF